MGDKRKFRIGQPVEVNLNHQVAVDYEDGGRYRKVKRAIDWGIKKETNDPVLAIVTGAKLFQEGTYHAGGGSSRFSNYGGHYEDYEPAYLSFDRNVEVWAVRTGYRNKEIYFFEQDLKITESLKMFDQWMCFPTSDIPFFYSGWTEHFKKKVSKESKDWARDEKGRWAKESKYAYKK